MFELEVIANKEALNKIQNKFKSDDFFVSLLGYRICLQIMNEISNFRVLSSIYKIFKRDYV